MRSLILIVMLAIFFSCNSGKTKISKDGTLYQRNMNASFKDASKSPLTAKDLKVFKGLDFFKDNEDYRVKALLTKTKDTIWFNMNTTTEEVSVERIYGKVEFELLGETFKLNVYQGKNHINSTDLYDYLFLPFLDDTNGKETYSGGRYIDLKIPSNDSIEIDFNKAYNPYCVYNKKFSCPIVPSENYIATSVKAGLKMYIKPEDN